MPTIATGDHVHPAVKLGCTSCHSIENREDASYVVLKQAKASLALSVISRRRFCTRIFPYASGMCMRCHNPHLSANPRLLRAKVNELCLSCHLRTAETVPSRYCRRSHSRPTTAWTSLRASSREWKSRSADRREMSCISCHLAHGGAQLHLLKMGAEIPEDALNQNTETKDMCRKCHLRLWGLDGAVSGKKSKKKKAN